MSEWKAVKIFLLIAAVVFVMLAIPPIGIYRRVKGVDAGKRDGGMKGPPRALSRDEMALIEQTFGLTLPPETITICIVFIHNWEAETAYLRIDIPSHAKERLLESDLFAGSEDETIPIFILLPPSAYAIDRWQLPPLEESRPGLSVDESNRRMMAVIQEGADGATSVYVRRWAQSDTYPDEFKKFMSPFIRQSRGMFPIPGSPQAFAECFALPAEYRNTPEAP